MTEQVHQIAYDAGIDPIEHAVWLVDVHLDARDVIRDARAHSPTAYPIFTLSLSAEATARRVVAELLNAGWKPPISLGRSSGCDGDNPSELTMPKLGDHAELGDTGLVMEWTGHAWTKCYVRGGQLMSGEPVVPQLDDPAVRAMAERHHQPAESWSVAGLLLSLHCNECGQAWPCATRRALQEQR